MGHEPSWIDDDQVDMHFTEDAQITELEDLRVKLLSFHQSITAPTYDSAESIATHPESDFDDEQLRTLLASPLYLQERGASILNEKTRGPVLSRSDNRRYRETCRSVFKPE